ncbi:hypothetical protein AAU57_01935 [Nonlabens sp. YIK11]|nr:hypothetical protein AAU57_01935 [Nonlabens sp. YIK11]
MEKEMKEIYEKDTAVFYASIGNTLFFIWVYLTYIFEIDWVIAGVFHELLMIPMIIAAPVLLITSIWMLLQKPFQWTVVVSLVLTAFVTVAITYLFYRDFSS